MYEFTTSVSNSQPAVSRAGEGDFIVNGGGSKTTLWLAIAAVAIVGLWLWFSKGK